MSGWLALLLLWSSFATGFVVGAWWAALWAEPER